MNLGLLEFGKQIAGQLEKTVTKKHKDKWERHGFVEEMSRYRGVLPMRGEDELDRLYDLVKSTSTRPNVEKPMVPLKQYSVFGDEYNERPEGIIAKAITKHIGSKALGDAYSRGVQKAVLGTWSALETKENKKQRTQELVRGYEGQSASRQYTVPEGSSLSDEEMQMIDDVVDFIPQIIVEEEQPKVLKI